MPEYGKWPFTLLAIVSVLRLSREAGVPVKPSNRQVTMRRIGLSPQRGNNRYEVFLPPTIRNPKRRRRFAAVWSERGDGAFGIYLWRSAFWAPRTVSRKCHRRAKYNPHVYPVYARFARHRVPRLYFDGSAVSVVYGTLFGIVSIDTFIRFGEV